MILRIGRKRLNKDGGFTLIELILVAAIIIALVAVSTPLFRKTFQGLQLKDAAYNIGKVIQYAQQRAIIEERKYSLAFNFEGRNYQLYAWEEAGEGKGFVRAKGRFHASIELPEGVEFKGEKDSIIFLPNGRCDKITLYLIGKDKQTFALKTNGRAGYVSIEEVHRQ